MNIVLEIVLEQTALFLEIDVGGGPNCAKVHCTVKAFFSEIDHPQP